LKVFEDEDETLADREALLSILDDTVIYTDPNEGGEFQP